MRPSNQQNQLLLTHKISEIKDDVGKLVRGSRTEISEITGGWPKSAKSAKPGAAPGRAKSRNPIKILEWGKILESNG
jgi:hypothetical protein